MAHSFNPNSQEAEGVSLSQHGLHSKFQESDQHNNTQLKKKKRIGPREKFFF